MFTTEPLSSSTKSDLNKRSLASKYLHFHVSKLFYIYDARAVKGIRTLTAIVGRASRDGNTGDIEYRRFAEKCCRLQEHCAVRFGLRFSPPAVDRLLLTLAKDET